MQNDSYQDVTLETKFCLSLHGQTDAIVVVDGQINAVREEEAIPCGHFQGYTFAFDAKWDDFDLESVDTVDLYHAMYTSRGHLRKPAETALFGEPLTELHYVADITLHPRLRGFDWGLQVLVDYFRVLQQIGSDGVVVFKPRSLERKYSDAVMARYWCRSGARCLTGSRSSSYYGLSLTRTIDCRQRARPASLTESQFRELEDAVFTIRQ